jgi:DNA-binding transcriptional LysR family regulator
MVPAYSDIVYFIEAAQTLNFSRAAERLGITQPTLSAAIKRLEDVLGSTLFIRERTGVRLTKAGDELLKKGRLLLLNWDQLKTDVKRKEEGVSGQYIIGCHPSVALSTLSDFLPDLLQRHPDLELQLKHDLSRKITEGVISFEVDFGIVVNPIKHPDLVIHELYLDDVLFWTAFNPSPTQNPNPASGVLICDLDLIQAQKLLGDIRKNDLGFKRIVRSSSLEVVAELTAAGAGIGILPKRVATRFKPKKLKPLTSSPVFKDRICLVYRADSQRTKAGRTLIEAIRRSIS